MTTFLSQREAFSRGLPKWPQFVLTGKPVTVEQAKEIIFRTDRFITRLDPYSSGNNKRWMNWAHKVLGYYPLIEDERNLSNQWIAYWAARAKAKQGGLDENTVPEPNQHFDNRVKDIIVNELNFICNKFLWNDWASSCYIGGPHGWCSPDGVICHVDNLGKYPSVEDIYDDLRRLKAAFPYLVMTGTIFDGEACEENTSPVITIVVNDDGIHFTDDHNSFHFDVAKPDRSTDAILKRLDSSFEQGLPDEWIIEYGKITRPVVERIMSLTEEELDKLQDKQFMDGLVIQRS